MLGSHVIISVVYGIRYRKVLSNLLQTSPLNQCLLSIDPYQLKKQGIDAIALDFDGVLAGHGSIKPLDSVQIWLRNAGEIFGENKIAILSNKATLSRKEWFSNFFPEMIFIEGVRKKPYPDGIAYASKAAETPITNIMMIDDRLLTGCLAAILAGAHPCWVNAPIITWNHKPLSELVFKTIRILEIYFIRFSCMMLMV